MPRYYGRKGYKGPLTPSQVLKLLKLGVYVVCPDTGRVSRGPREITPFWHDNYAYVRLYHCGHRKVVSVHRLVWMSSAGCLIPRGFEVHHRDLDCRNNAWDNLVCLHALDHRKEHTDEPAGLEF